MSFYDDLAERYHLLFDDWWVAIDDTGRILDRLLRDAAVEPPGPVLDCSCGIGTQVLGLAPRGWDLVGTDLSEPAVARARREATGHDVDARFAVADMRALDDAGVGDEFAAVISFDNSLAHLLTDEDLAAALTGMRARLAPGGRLLASVRDYDALLAEPGPAPLHHVQTGAVRPRGTFPHVVDGPEGRRVVVQAWDWVGDECYDVDLFILEERDGRWDTGHWRTRSRAWRRAELEAAVADAGFVDVTWRSAAEAGYYQPVITGRAA